MTAAPFIRRLGPLALATALACCGCTVQRIEQDTSETLQWLRLEHGAELHPVGRWQLPRDATIDVQELAPAPDADWLPAAQLGVDSVFSAPAATADRAFKLMVAWPPSQASASQRASLWEMVGLQRYLPDLQGPFELQVALVRSADGAVVEAAQVEVSPHWFSDRAGTGYVRHAFHEFAASFRPAY